MTLKRKLVSFDWALKKLLRSKANFGILEGFLSELLREDIRIESILESETNRDDALLKQSRVDLKCLNTAGEILLIELQYERQDDFLSRMLFGSAKVVTEHLPAGQSYSDIPKVIAISLVHFDLGHGNDYVYHGRTSFTGLHDPNDVLRLNANEQALYRRPDVAGVFPEYYILKINEFDGVAKDGLDEWIRFLQTSEVAENARAKGLEEAKHKLDILQLSPAERHAYDAFEQDLHQRASMANMMETHYREGREEGHQKGREEGRQEGRQEGLEQGREQGLERGTIEATQGAIFAVLEARHISIDAEQRSRILNCNSLSELNAWLARAATVENTEDLFIS